jgi:hypothetical protein
MGWQMPSTTQAYSQGGTLTDCSFRAGTSLLTSFISKSKVIKTFKRLNGFPDTCKTVKTLHVWDAYINWRLFSRHMQ